MRSSWWCMAPMFQPFCSITAGVKQILSPGVVAAGTCLATDRRYRAKKASEGRCNAAHCRHFLIGCPGEFFFFSPFRPNPAAAAWALCSEHEL